MVIVSREIDFNITKTQDIILHFCKKKKKKFFLSKYDRIVILHASKTFKLSLYKGVSTGA